MAELKGISEIKAVLLALKDLAIDGKKVMADGKIDLSDLPVAMDLLKQQNDFVAAIKGMSELMPEAKDLSSQEMMEVVAALFSAFKEVQAA